MHFKNRHAKFFKENARDNLGNATDVLGFHYDTIYYPHSRAVYHAASFTYPLISAVKCLRSAARIIQGSLFLIEAVFNEPKESVPAVLTGMAFELGALMVNAINIAVSLVSLVTKTLSTCTVGLMRSGYFSLRREAYPLSMDALNSESHSSEVTLEKYDETAFRVNTAFHNYGRG